MKDEGGEEKTFQQLRGLRVVHISDISWTEGELIADRDALKAQLLNGEPPKGVWDVLVSQANDA